MVAFLHRAPTPNLACVSCSEVVQPCSVCRTLSSYGRPLPATAGLSATPLRIRRGASLQPGLRRKACALCGCCHHPYTVNVDSGLFTVQHLRGAAIWLAPWAALVRAFINIYTSADPGFVFTPLDLVNNPINILKIEGFQWRFIDQYWVCFCFDFHSLFLMWCPYTIKPLWVNSVYFAFSMCCIGELLHPASFGPFLPKRAAALGGAHKLCVTTFNIEVAWC